MLNRLTLVSGKLVEQDSANLPAQNAELHVGRGIVPACANRGAKQAVFCRRQGGQRILNVPLKGRASGLHEDKVLKSRGDRKIARPRSRYVGGLILATRLNKCRGVRLSPALSMLPRFLRYGNFGG